MFKVVPDSNYSRQASLLVLAGALDPASGKKSSIERLEKGGQRDYEGNLAHSLSRVIKQPVTAPHIPLPLAEIRTAAANAAGAALS